MNKLERILKNKATWSKVLILLTLSIIFATLIITQVFGLLNINPHLTMDASNYYTSSVFYENIEKLGVEGRKTYLLIHIFDYFYIGFSYTFFVFLIYMLIRNFKGYASLKFLLVPPLLAGIFDLLENIGIDLSIVIWPRKLKVISNLSGYFTTLKMKMVYLTFIIILITSFSFVLKKLKNIYSER